MKKTIDATHDHDHRAQEPARTCGYSSDAPAMKCTRPATIRVTSDHGAAMYLCDYHAGVFGAVFAKYFTL